MNEVKEIEVENAEDERNKKFEKMSEIEKIMDDALFDTQASLANLDK